MENPFPGVNPYIESQGFWRDFHTAFIGTIRATLNDVLPDSFRAFAEEDIHVAYSKASYRPDVVVMARQQAKQSITPDSRSIPRRNEKGEPAPILFLLPEDRTRFIQILHAANGTREVVTTIEIISPTHKLYPLGRQRYLNKQEMLLGSDVSLIEVDLLRAGDPLVFAPSDILEGTWDFMVTLHRAWEENAGAWPISLRDPLPQIPVPLKPDRDDVLLDLNAVVQRVFRESGYGEFLDYGQPLHPPLRNADADWANSLLREKGLLPA